MTAFRINIAQSIRAYGYVDVEADTLDAAKAKVDHDYILENFSPHGGGTDDFDYANAADVYLTEWENKDTGDVGELFQRLPDEHQDPAEMKAALGQLIEQVYQMQGMFPDEDGAIARAVTDAEEALK